MKKLYIEKSYTIYINYFFFFKSKKKLKPIIDKFNYKLTGENISKLKIFDSTFKEIKNSQTLIFRAYPYIEAFNIEIYELCFSNSNTKRFLEILDIGVYQRFRGRGIGSQLMAIIDKIAKNNNVKLIMAELQKERSGEPLVKTKNFYVQHGFLLSFDQRSSQSGWIAKKYLY